MYSAGVHNERYLFILFFFLFICRFQQSNGLFLLLFYFLHFFIFKLLLKMNETLQNRRKLFFDFIHSYHTWKKTANKQEHLSECFNVIANAFVPVYLNTKCIRILFHFFCIYYFVLKVICFFDHNGFGHSDKSKQFLH